MANTSFKDYFSGHADDYQQYRPGYPTELFSFLARLCRTHEHAWDCATGNGQAALMLSDYFQQVTATDASAQQIANVTKKEGVHYQVAPAEKTTIQDQSINLITVAQAFHWFDQDAFIKEADRVLKPNGVMAIWTYNLLTVNPQIDALIHSLYADTLGDYWAFERSQVEQGYDGVQLPSPWQPQPVPNFEMRSQWNLAQLVGYLNTWSAVKNYLKKQQANPVKTLYPRLQQQWGDPESLLPVIWPLSVKVWRK